MPETTEKQEKTTAKSRRKAIPILRFVIFTLLLVIVLQSAFSFMTIWGTNITTTVENYAYRSFTQNVDNRANTLQTQMVQQWTNITSACESITTLYQYFANNSDELTEQQKEEFLFQSVPLVMEMMTASGVTGGFIVLDDGEVDGQAFSSLYLKSNNYLTQTVRESTLMLTVGPPAINKAYGIALDFDWTYAMPLTADRYDVLDQPMQAAQLTQNLEHLGYWQISADVIDNSSQVLTYSIPIISGDGVAVGIVGVSITQQQMNLFLPSDEFGQTGSYGYLLATSDDQNKDTAHSFTTMLNNTSSEVKKQFVINESTTTQDLNLDKSGLHVIPRLLQADDMELCVYSKNLTIYPNNSPFASNDLWIVGVMDMNNVHEFTLVFWSAITTMLVISIIGACIIAYVIGIRAAAPVVKLSKTVDGFDPRREIVFDKTYITELDDLSDVISRLQRANIQHSASKTDKILELLNMGVGSYEHIKNTDYVTVSQAIPKMLQIDCEEGEVQVINATDFFATLNDLKTRPIQELANTYATEGSLKKYYTVQEFEQQDAVLGIIEDSTKEVEDLMLLSYERNYDVLTGIYNRRAFQQKVEEVFVNGNMKTAAFIMFDLDNLKYVNDTFGHECGDIYIKTAANIINKSLSDHGIVGRMSGDEFYAYLYDFDNRAQVLDNLKKLYKTLENEPIEMPNGKDFQIRMSGGIAWYGDDSNNLDELMKYADFAMYKGKQNLKGELREFEKRSYINESFMLSGKEELNRILDNELVNFIFQPIINVKTGKIHAYEALMRPISETLSTPTKFLQIASLEGKLWKVEKITFFKTLFLYKKYKDLFAGAKLFINSIPIENLTDREYFELESLYNDCLPYLVVEITEQEQQEETLIQAKLDKLHSLNLEIALDDYGSGYANDVSLLNIMPNIVKIDRSLITNVHVDPSRQTIVNKIIGFCNEHNITVLGEGIETEQELEYMINAGIELAQGYYISRPIELPEFDTSEIEAKLAELKL